MSRDAKSNIQRIAAILKGFDARNTPRRSQDILDDLGMARSTGFGLMRAMARAGWLERYDHGLMRLGPKARGLAFAPLEAEDDSDAAALRGAPDRMAVADAPTALPDLEWDPSLVRAIDTRAFAARPPYRIGFFQRVCRQCVAAGHA